MSSDKGLSVYSEKIAQAFQHIRTATMRIETFTAGMTLDEFADDIRQCPQSSASSRSSLRPHTG
jgi:hypothetical protein